MEGHVLALPEKKYVLLFGRMQWGMQRMFEKKYNMDENYSLSEYNKIPLGHNRTNDAVYSNMNFKVEICSAL